MGSYACPRCNGSGTEKKTEISWSTQKTETKTVTCEKCGGSGNINRDGSPGYNHSRY